MRIAVLAAGGVGAHFGARLHRCGPRSAFLVAPGRKPPNCRSL